MLLSLILPLWHQYWDKTGFLKLDSCFWLPDRSPSAPSWSARQAGTLLCALPADVAESVVLWEDCDRCAPQSRSTRAAAFGSHIRAFGPLKHGCGAMCSTLNIHFAISTPPSRQCPTHQRHYVHAWNLRAPADPRVDAMAAGGGRSLAPNVSPGRWKRAAPVLWCSCCADKHAFRSWYWAGQSITSRNVELHSVGGWWWCRGNSLLWARTYLTHRISQENNPPATWTCKDVHTLGFWSSSYPDYL